ncbi:MAG: DUF933 domain-containing protein, partial [Anaerolineales bacterium]
HPQGSVDAFRDFKALEFEFLISDLAIVEKRLERLAHDLERKRSYPEKKQDQEERSLLERVKEFLESERPIRDMELADEDAKKLRGFQFITAKPVLVAINVGDDGSEDPADYPFQESDVLRVVCLRGALEMEISQLSGDDAALFLDEFGINEPGLNRMIRMSYQLLGQQSFFTVGEDEVRAWTVSHGARAVEAAGAIHTDLARGFIRAEVIAYQDLVESGSLAEGRKRGKLRLEGKEYLVQDGDILNIRFNV